MNTAESYCVIRGEFYIQIGANPPMKDIHWYADNDNWFTRFVHSCGEDTFELTINGPRCCGCKAYISSNDWPGRA